MQHEAVDVRKEERRSQKNTAADQKFALRSLDRSRWDDWLDDGWDEYGDECGDLQWSLSGPHKAWDMVFSLFSKANTCR